MIGHELVPWADLLREAEIDELELPALLGVCKSARQNGKPRSEAKHERGGRKRAEGTQQGEAKRAKQREAK